MKGEDDIYELIRIAAIKLLLHRLPRAKRRAPLYVRFAVEHNNPVIFILFIGLKKSGLLRTTSAGSGYTICIPVAVPVCTLNV